MTRRRLITTGARGLLVRADDLLRGRLDAAPAPAAHAFLRALPRLLLMTAAFGALYGATMGTFVGVAGDRPLQILYSAIKVPILLLVSFGLSLPSFLVLNTVMGVRADLRDVLRALVSAQAGLTIVLASLAPLTAFWYASDGDYSAALLFNAAMFGVATLAAQWMLRRSYRPLIARNPRHRLLLRTWVVLYAFVAIQMAWVLRPFVGAPAVRVTFFRHEAWGNAYVELARIAARAIGL